MRITPRLRAGDTARQHGLSAFDSIAPEYPWWGQWTQAGKHVSVTEAFGLPAVFACIRRKANTVGQMPLVAKEYVDATMQDSKPAPSDPMFKTLALKPNPEMQATAVWAFVEQHLAAWGEAFIGKEFVPGRRQPVNLWPIDPGRVEVERVKGQKLFWVRDQYGRRKGPYTSADIIHIIGFTLDGLRGVSPIALAREAIGAGIALDEFANRLWSNGGVLAGVFSTDKELDADTADRLEKRLQRKYRGPRNAGKFAVLEDGLKYQAISMPLKDMEFVAEQKWTLQQAARVIGVPLSLVGADTQDSSLTYRTVEGDNLQYLTHDVNPDLSRIEQAVTADDDCFPNPRRFCQFDPRVLLRSSALEQAKVFAIETGGRAWRHPSEIRKDLGYTPDATIDDPVANPPTEHPPGESPPSLR